MLHAIAFLIPAAQLVQVLQQCHTHTVNFSKVGDLICMSSIPVLKRASCCSTLVGRSLEAGLIWGVDFVHVGARSVPGLS